MQVQPVAAEPPVQWRVPVQATPQQSVSLAIVLSSQPFAADPSQFAKLPLHDTTVQTFAAQPAVPCMKPLVQFVAHMTPQAVGD